MDQFTYAERATDWRGNNNIAQSIFEQLSLEKHPVPQWIVMSAGTGGTSATLGRYIRYQCHATQLCVVDPENSAFYDFYLTGQETLTEGSIIEGIGRPRVEPSFIPTVIDDMQRIPDTLSIATMQWLETLLGRKVGPSTGTNFAGALIKAREMRVNNQSGSLVTLICDSGDRYLESYYNPSWLSEHLGNLTEGQQALQALLAN
jgi:cysteine synthase A